MSIDQGQQRSSVVALMPNHWEVPSSSSKVELKWKKIEVLLQCCWIFLIFFFETVPHQIGLSVLSTICHRYLNAILNLYIFNYNHRLYYRCFLKSIESYLPKKKFWMNECNLCRYKFHKNLIFSIQIVKKKNCIFECNIHIIFRILYDWLKTWR